MLVVTSRQICSDRTFFEKDYNAIKDNLLKNQYPENLIEAVKKNFMTLKRQPVDDQPVELTIPKKEIIMCLPFLGDSSNKLRKSLLNLLKSAYPQSNWKLFSALHSALPTYFRLKIRYLQGLNLSLWMEYTVQIAKDWKDRFLLSFSDIYLLREFFSLITIFTTSLSVI